MKAVVKRLLNAVAPRWLTAIQSARARSHLQRLYEQWGCTNLARKLQFHIGNRVLEGPFAGLLLSPKTIVENPNPILLGVYEYELDAAWEIVFQGRYNQILDIGAKFGYYAVGLARRFPETPIIAFDTDWWARDVMAEMLQLNRVTNVTIESFCSCAWLQESLQSPAFILCDCEGYEDSLFTNETLPKLRDATLIIETHDIFVPGVSDRLKKSFAPTHVIREYGRDCRPRLSSHTLDFLTSEERDLAHREFRDEQIWLLCLPRQGPNCHLADLAVNSSG